MTDEKETEIKKDDLETKKQKQDKTLKHYLWLAMPLFNIIFSSVILTTELIGKHYILSFLPAFNILFGFYCLFLIYSAENKFIEIAYRKLIITKGIFAFLPTLLIQIAMLIFFRNNSITFFFESGKLKYESNLFLISTLIIITSVNLIGIVKTGLTKNDRNKLTATDLFFINKASRNLNIFIAIYYLVITIGIFLFFLKYRTKSMSLFALKQIAPI